MIHLTFHDLFELLSNSQSESTVNKQIALKIILEIESKESAPGSYFINIFRYLNCSVKYNPLNAITDILIEKNSFLKYTLFNIGRKRHYFI